MSLNFKLTRFAFGCFAFACVVFGAEPSETACTAKCGVSEENDKDTIQKAYEELDSRLFDKKDELLDDIKDFLLNEDDHPSEDYQDEFSDLREKWDEDIESVDFNKVKQDSRTILKDIDEWVHTLDLSSLREDGEKQVDYYRKYIEDYRTIKDDFIDGNIKDFLSSYIGELNLKTSFKHSKGSSSKSADTILKTNGLQATNNSKKNKARAKALLNECKARFNEIKDERQEDYEELKEKYKDVHEDLKNKKRRWKELKKSWRRKNDAEYMNNGK